MFEGVQDQFHQFLAAAAAASSSRPPMRGAATPTHHHDHHHHHQALPFSLLHGCTSPPPPPPPPVFDSYSHPQPPSLHHHQHQIQQQLHLQWPPPAAAHCTNKHLVVVGGGGVKQQGESIMTSCGFLSTSLVVERDRSIMAPSDFTDSAAWSPDELLALLRIRSALDNCFPHFTWEHVSRKLAEMGFKRSPQKCKEKFEEESRSYLIHPSTTSTSANDTTKVNNSYRLFSELEELYNHGHDHHHHHMLQQQPAEALVPDENQVSDAILEKQNPQSQEQEQEEEMGSGGGGEANEEIRKEERLMFEENDGSDATHDDKIDDDDDVKGEETAKSQRKKRRFEYHHQMINSKKKFEIFKSFCEEIVNKMMTQQEELHNKILQDMIRRDDEKIAREEAWKKQEMDRINLEMEARANDLALVAQRQAKIIEFLNKFSVNNDHNNNINNYNDDNDNDNEPAAKSAHQNPSSTATVHSSSNEESISQTSTPNTNKTQPSFRKPRRNKRPRGEDNDIGKRWPREEVLALINIRSNVDLNTKTTAGDDNSNSNNSSKNAPLWERISQKMIDSGYNRSSKRCKEKWENINKYFRKTKDMNKNRSVDSRTCPYFHQLSHLYSQGRGGSASSNGADAGDQGEGVSGVQVAVSASDPPEF